MDDLTICPVCYNLPPGSLEVNRLLETRDAPPLYLLSGRGHNAKARLPCLFFHGPSLP